MVSIKLSDEFKRQVKPLAKKYKSLTSDFAKLLASLENNPLQGADLGNGVRKVRLSIASKGRGKSGGARVITYVVSEMEGNKNVTLLTIYDKSEIENVTDQYIKSIIEQL